MKGFPEAIETVFPETSIQLCVVHMVRNSLRYVPWKQRKTVAADLKTIYRAATFEEAEMNLDLVSETWDESYPTISRSWRSNWERLIPFCSYPAEIRKVIYTTNAVESLNYSPRRVLKTRGSMPSDEAILKLLYLAIQRAAKKWTRPIQNWTAALSRFAIMFEDRMPVT